MAIPENIDESVADFVDATTAEAGDFVTPVLGGSIVAKLAKRFGRIAANTQAVYLPKEEEIANAILDVCCLSESQRRGLLDKNHLFVAGDGTKLPVHGNSYGKKVCSCDDKHCDCKRYSNAKEASIGYDAYRDTYIYSHSLYQLTRCSMDHTLELPTYLLMTTGCRHDSVTGSFAMNRATQRVSVDKACFDAAHDAGAFYQMADSLWQTEVFIPLNSTNEGNYQQVPMATISQKGIPRSSAQVSDLSRRTRNVLLGAL